MKKEMDIHDYSRRLNTAVRLVGKAQISERNRKTILDFRDFCSMEDMSLSRIERYMGILVHWAKILNKDFDIAAKEDIMRAVRVIQENEAYAAWTKATYKIMLKRFFRWLKNTGAEHPEEVKWINTCIKLTDKKLPANGDLLNEEEVMRIIDAAEHIRDKAFISLLYESGSRIGELASLQIGNVKLDQYGAILNVTGKTGPRPIRVITSTPYLMALMQTHPFKDNPEAPLWLNFGNQRHNSLMKYANIRNMLLKLCAKAGIKKRCNPHMFRHSRATFLADHLTEFQMNQYFGWIQGSKMPSTYIHMSGSRIDASILALNGISNPETKKESVIKPKLCPRCDTINVPEAKFCIRCAGILDLKTACELEEKNAKEKEIRHDYDDVLNVLVKDPEFLSMLLNKVKETGLQDKLQGRM
jgi:integrase